MSHYRTEIYAATKARIEGARLVASGRFTIERVEPVTCRTAAEAANELPVINIAMPQGSRDRATEAGPLKGDATLEVEVLVTGASTEAVATARDTLVESIENLLLADPLAWSGGRWKVLGVTDAVSQSQDGDVLTGFAKLSLRLEIATVPELVVEEMVELVVVDVQTTEPDDDTTEMTFEAAPSVVEE